MNTPYAIIVSGAIIAGAILIRDNVPMEEAYASPGGMGRYMALSTDAIIRVNVIDTHTGAVRHCFTEDYQQHTSKCSKWIGESRLPL